MEEREKNCAIVYAIEEASKMLICMFINPPKMPLGLSYFFNHMFMSEVADYLLKRESFSRQRSSRYKAKGKGGEESK